MIKVKYDNSKSARTRYIKDQITKLTLEYLQLEKSWESDAEYIKYRDLAYKVKNKIIDSNIPKLKILNSQISQLEETYKLFSVKKEYELPANLEEFREKCMRGVDYGPKGLVPVMSWDDRFVLLKRHGHNA